jgi:hypothetical protein
LQVDFEVYEVIHGRVDAMLNYRCLSHGRSALQGLKKQQSRTTCVVELIRICLMTIAVLQLRLESCNPHDLSHCTLASTYEQLQP